jgi:hypothetical protein
MKNLTFEQRIALQLGELILEIKRLETLHDQMSDEISKLAQDKTSGEIQSLLEPQNAPSA